MLAPLTAAGIPAFTAACAHERVFGSRALTALRAYGLSGPARFYLLTEGGGPAAALYLSDGALTVSADERADPAPIAALIRQTGAAEADTNWAQCAALQHILGGTTDSSYCMVYRGAPDGREAFPDIVPGRLESVFDVLQRSHEYYRTHLDFAVWSADMTRRLSRGLSELYQLERDGKPVGTGCIASGDDECGVIAAVAVVPAYRGQGLGSRITRFLTQRILQKGKTPRLIAGYDEVAELYRRLGFAACGRWGELYLD